MRALLRESHNPFRLLVAFQKSPYRFFDQVKPQNPLEIKKLRLGLRTFYFCYHPDQAKHILETNKDNYPKSSLVLKKILPLSGPKGLIQLRDPDAQPVRKIAGNLMHPDRTLRLSHFIESCVSEEFPSLDSASQTHSVIDLKPFLTQLVLRTAGMFILNEDIHSKAGELNHAFVELNRMAGESLRAVISLPYSHKRRRYLKVIHAGLDQIIQDKLLRDETSLLHELHRKTFSLSFIRDQVKAFMFAGYDTTASSLIFAVDSIARDLEVQEKIFSERSLNYRSAFYTQAAYKESLRLYPSAYFLPRQIAKDDVILGQQVKAGRQIFISIRHVQRSPDIFTNPNVFIPERFLEKLPHTHAFLPFGGGTRICIGAPLALMEATVVLQKLCERYRMIPVRREPPEIEGLITAHTKSPLHVRLERRTAC